MCKEVKIFVHCWIALLNRMYFSILKRSFVKCSVLRNHNIIYCYIP